MACWFKSGIHRASAATLLRKSFNSVALFSLDAPVDPAKSRPISTRRAAGEPGKLARKRVVDPALHVDESELRVLLVSPKAEHHGAQELPAVRPERLVVARPDQRTTRVRDGLHRTEHVVDRYRTAGALCSWIDPRVLEDSLRVN